MYLDAQGTGKEGVNVIEFSLSLHQPEGPIEAGSSREVGSNQDIDIFANHLAWVKKQGTYILAQSSLLVDKSRSVGDYDRNASGIFQPHDGVWPGTLVDVSTGLEQEHLTNSRIEKRRQL